MKITAPPLPAIALTAMVSCTTPSGQNSSPASHHAGSSLSGQVSQDVNAYRRSHGAKDLQRHAGLDRLALDHCEYLRKNRGSFDLYGKNVSHNGAEGRSLVAMKSLKMLNSSENVASTMRGASDAQTSGFLVKLWQKSSDHDYAMRNPAWTHTGVATVVDADGRVFATQLFGTISLSQLSTRDRFSGF